MQTSSLRIQLSAIDDGLLTTDRCLQKLESLISYLAGQSADRQWAERLLVHFAGVRRRFDTLRECLIGELAEAQQQQNVSQLQMRSPRIFVG